MNVIWCDTETTGIEVEDSGAFEISIIFAKDGQVIEEKTWQLNPLNDKIKFSEGAYKIHNITEEEIKNYSACEDVVPCIVDFLNTLIDTACNGEKLIFAGYCCDFDYKHLNALLERCGYKMDDYFDKQLDVYKLVKRASAQKVIPYLENLKLKTLCEYFGIILTKAHNSISDIRATRQLCIELYKRGIKDAN